MYAVIKTGGKQYRVQAGDMLVVEKLEGDAGAEVSFDQVLMLGLGLVGCACELLLQMLMLLPQQGEFLVAPQGLLQDGTVGRLHLLAQGANAQGLVTTHHTRIHLFQPFNNAQKSGLARAIGTDQADLFIGMNGQTGLVQVGLRAEAFADIFQ